MARWMGLAAALWCVANPATAQERAADPPPLVVVTLEGADTPSEVAPHRRNAWFPGYSVTRASGWSGAGRRGRSRIAP